MSAPACSRCEIEHAGKCKCWLCLKTLCDKCAEQIGHCGHPVADAIIVTVGAARKMGFDTRKLTAKLVRKARRDLWN